MEGWAERVSELEEDMSRCEVAHSGMLQDVATKDERIMVCSVLAFILVCCSLMYMVAAGNSVLFISSDLKTGNILNYYPRRLHVLFL